MIQRGFLIPIFLFILIVLVLWSPDFLWKLRSLPVPSQPIEGEFEVLRAENSYLKARLADQVGGFEELPLSFGTALANVYSRYPLNFKHELVIDKGARDQIAPGAVVVVPDSESSSSSKVFLVGSITSVWKSKGFVRTIFDHRFKDAVHIGSKKISGLFVGGLNPTVSLIPKDAKISSGDVVISASPELPYGVILGRIKEIRPSSDQLFKEASLEVLYDINNLTAVAVEIN